MNMLCEQASAQLLVVDVQEKLQCVMREGEAAVLNMRRLIDGARLLDIPVTVTEHYVRGLGRTLAPLRAALGKSAPVFEKITFSAARDGPLAGHVAALANTHNRRQIVVCGIEAHICVLQTAMDFAAMGYGVVVAADAIASRAAISLDIALRRLGQAGVTLATTEMILFEWLERADRPQFKPIARSIR
jgi:nicotinamidase-related amidase